MTEQREPKHDPEIDAALQRIGSILGWDERPAPPPLCKSDEDDTHDWADAYRNW